MKLRHFTSIAIPALCVVALVLLSVAIALPTETDALMPGGGYHASFVMYCTCSGGYLSVVAGAPPTPSGLYYFSLGTIRLNATSMMPGAFWLGYLTPGAGACMIWIPSFPSPICIPIMGNLMNAYGGSH